MICVIDLCTSMQEGYCNVGHADCRAQQLSYMPVYYAPRTIDTPGSSPTYSHNKKETCSSYVYTVSYSYTQYPT